MGTATFAELKTYVKLRFGNDDDLDSGATNFYGKWVNDAYMLLTTRDRIWGLKRSFRFPELETTAAKSTTDGVGYVTVPTDGLVLYHVYDATNNLKLDYIPYNAYVEYTDRADTDSEDKPTEWAHYGSNIYVHPTPDATYSLTVSYRKRPVVLTGTDTTVIGAEWDEVIVELATFIGKKYMRQFEEMKISKEEAETMMAGLISLHTHEARDREEYWTLDSAAEDPGY